MSSLRSFPGKTRLVDVVGRMYGHFGGGQASVRLSSRASIVVDLRDRVQRQMWAGCYEPHTRKCLESLLQEGDVFLDIGAHIGYFSMIAGNLVGPNGRVFAFEADPANFEILEHNMARMPWVQALPHAVWKEEGALIFERSSSPGESGWGTLTAVRDLGQGHHMRVDAIALDQWTSRVPLHCIQAVKIDAEGSEFAILSGAQYTLQRYRPLLAIEMNDVLLHQAGASSKELAAKLSDYGYNVFGLTWMQIQHIPEGKPVETLEALAIPCEKTEGILQKLGAAEFRVC